MKKYVYKSYSEIFPMLFAKEKERIAANVKSILSIEHIGSTAVPGLGGKGIIDIAIAASKQDMEFVSKQLQSLGYEFRPNFSTPDRFYFVIYLPDPEEQTRRYHIHLTYPENHEWQKFLGFRDYLKAHPETAKEYGEMKKQAALEANHEGERYRKLKEPMFQKFKDFLSNYDDKDEVNYIERAKNLFEWNKQNLVSSSQLKKEDIARFFAVEFQVEANGRSYAANYDSYYDFLNQFREDIRSISYNLKEFIESKNAVVIPLSAKIVRTNGQEEHFEAILILKFDEYGKITLWHEVYVGDGQK